MVLGRPQVGLSAMKRGLMLLSLVVALILAVLPAAVAQDSEEVAASVAETGVYVASGSDASAVRVGELVGALRNAGENISMVVLDEEPLAGATTFAGAVSDRVGGGLVLVVAPETIGIDGISQEFGDVEIEEAVNASFAGESDLGVLEIFTETLIGNVVATDTGDGASATTPEPAAAGSETTSGGNGFLIFLVVVAGGALLFFWWRSRQAKTKGPRLHPGLAEAKEAVQQQINAVANDIIDMEDEVRGADNDRVDEFYQAAGRTYNTVTEAFPEATTPQAVLDLSNELDEAIWQLDSAEALLDGKPLPDRPRPKRLPAPEPAGAPSDSRPSGGSALPPRPSYDQPTFDRRSSRRSSYSTGPGVMDLLMGVAGAMMAGRGRGGGGLLGGLGSRRSSTTTARSRRVPPQQFPSVPSSRSGGPIVPSPSRSSSSRGSSRSSGSRSSRTRRGKTGRVRAGGRRRRG